MARLGQFVFHPGRDGLYGGAGGGVSKPLVPNDKAEDHAKDRRVELLVQP